MVIKFEGTFADILGDMYEFLNHVTDPRDDAQQEQPTPTPAENAQSAPSVKPEPVENAQPAPAPTAVPVAPPKSYTLDEVMNAAAQLMDAGRMADLQALLPKYNVVSVNMLAPEQLGAFAADLRELGAKL